MRGSARPEVVVIGAGISGLAAAFELTGGATPLGHAAPIVTIIDAAERAGGKIGTTSIDGRTLDAAADGVLARRPEVLALAADLGAADTLEPIATSGASVFARGKLRPLPDDLMLGIPTSWSALRTSGVLSTRGLLRALGDVIAPRPASRGHLQDRTIGGLVETKLGPEVVATLVDPMIGGISAGRVSEMSAAAVFPPLLEAAQERGSLMAALRASTAPANPGPAAHDPADGEPSEEPLAPSPSFVSFPHGMHDLPALLVTVLKARGVRFAFNSEITGLRRGGGTDPRWLVDAATTTTPADGVVIAAPARPTARILRPWDAEAAALLEQIDYASVSVVTFVFDEGTVTLPATGTGVLVPPGTPIPAGPNQGDRFLTTALTFLDRKWPHLTAAGTLLVRASIGRIDDDRMTAMSDSEIIEAVTEELTILLGPFEAPRAVSVVRWTDALPQYRVNHLMRVAGIEAAVERLGGIEICGAAYRGIGIPACVGSGRAAGARLLAELTTAP